MPRTIAGVPFSRYVRRSRTVGRLVRSPGEDQRHDELEEVDLSLSLLDPYFATNASMASFQNFPKLPSKVVARHLAPHPQPALSVIQPGRQERFAYDHV